MAWLTGSLIENGWLTGDIDSPVNNIKLIIGPSNPVVDIYGQPVNHIFDYWFITQSDIDLSNYNGQPISIVNKGDSLDITNGQGEVLTNLANIGETYQLVGFDTDQSNYFRYTGIAVEET